MTAAENKKYISKNHRAAGRKALYHYRNLFVLIWSREFVLFYATHVGTFSVKIAFNYEHDTAALCFCALFLKRGKKGQMQSNKCKKKVGAHTYMRKF